MKRKLWTIIFSIMLTLSISSCKINSPELSSEQSIDIDVSTYEEETEGAIYLDSSENVIDEGSSLSRTESFDEIPRDDDNFTIEKVQPYDREAYIELNNNIPSFSDSDRRITQAFEFYSDLDALGRCRQAYANICPEIQPTEERSAIGQIRPSGWHIVKYNDLIDGNYLYNRCHLIGYQLAGENANEKNLITGTRYLNVVGMLQFENQVNDYVSLTGNHVLYRVTPMFEGDNLVASGVQIEAWSVEDGGKGICFNVYCYNVQPGIEIDYATGESWVSEAVPNNDDTNAHVDEQNGDDSVDTGLEANYVINKNTKKFHLPTCSSVNDMAEHNKQMYVGTIQELINQGYSPCQRCLKEY